MSIIDGYDLDDLLDKYDKLLAYVRELADNRSFSAYTLLKEIGELNE